MAAAKEQSSKVAWIFRKAELSDLEPIMKLEQAVFENDAWSEQNMLAELTGPWRHYLVAVTDQTPAELGGYIGLLAPGEQADIQTVAVASKYRGQGLGRALMTSALGIAREAGAKQVFLEVRADNPVAQNLYNSLGFKQISLRKNYYQADGVDALVMSLELAEAQTSVAKALAKSLAKETPLVLGIESSCDETGVGIVRGNRVLANVIASSMAEHARFGGVVPEIAARAHLEAFDSVLAEALKLSKVKLSELDAIAVTIGPGLSGALMVGVAAAKALAAALDKPLYAVNHLVGHVAADLLELDSAPAGLDNATRASVSTDNAQESSPKVALLVSGGHTEILLVSDIANKVELLGSTIDDAAGEAFDKVARMLGLGYPGGPAIDKAAQGGNPKAINFPRALSLPKDLVNHRYDFSFSGLKTAVARWIEREQDSGRELNIADIAASFREAVVDVLVTKTIAAAKEHSVKSILLGGGVAANQRLRAELAKRCADEGLSLRIPPLELCTDNGAMIAGLAAMRIQSGAAPSRLEVPSKSVLSVEEIQL